MATQTVDGVFLHSMLENGYRNLKANMSVIDDLNVFPIPDGDTGKNMTMTMEGGVVKTENAAGNAGDMMEDFARGSLLSARGNSGVILSQFIRGMANGMAGRELMQVSDFAGALQEGVKKAYSSVANPVEGTMLTVMREGADRFAASSAEDWETRMTELVTEMRASLARTPSLLPVLKEAGVVDSGGAGLICIMEGMLWALQGRFVADDQPPMAAYTAPLDAMDPDRLLSYGYCTEFILQVQPQKTDIDTLDRQTVIDELSRLGESIVVVWEAPLLKVHVHSFAPEQVLAYARTMGEFISLKIENMAVQHNETVAAAPVKPYGVVATACGEGIASYFREIGADVIVDGGQTNNPAAQAFLEAFDACRAEHIIVLPNDSNIILTAQQAAALYTGADVRVIPTKSIAEGYSALSMMDLSGDSVEDVIATMTEYLDGVTTGYVTTATRDAVIGGVAVTKGHYIGLTEDTIYADGTNKVDTLLALMAALPDLEDKQVVTGFVGKDVTPHELDDLKARFARSFPLVELGLLEGGQDIYSFILAIE